MAVTLDKPAPYAPASAILDIIGRYRNRGLIFPVTSEVLTRAGISDSLNSRTLQALQTLDLFGADGNPTATMEAIRLAPEPEYKQRLADWLKSAYADVFAFVDPTTDDETRIRDAFRGYNPIGQQARMVTLFQGLCAAAGLVADKPAAPRPAARQQNRQAQRPQKATPAHTPKRTAAAANANAYGLPPAIAGLVESLPSPEDGWTAAERDKFITTFKAVLDFAIPVVSKRAANPAEDEAA